MRIVPEDLTARARIVHAAIECFAAEGFDASVRTIANKAGVSPGLITHHFGSKAALREECDHHVLETLKQAKTEGIAAGPAQTIAYLAAPGDLGPHLVYLLRAVNAGGPLGKAFIEQLIEDSRDYMALAVETGQIKPSRDEDARVRYIISLSLGGLLIEMNMHPDIDLADFPRVVQALQEDWMLPSLELYTEGLFTTSERLDQYLQYREASERGEGPHATGE